MYYSSEIRWFARTKEVLYPLFLKLPGDAFSNALREDHYLVTEVDYLNVKLREGKVELKWRTAPSLPFRIGEIVIGRQEEWVKASFEDQDPIQSNLRNMSSSNYTWISILKERQQKKYGIHPKNSISPVGNDASVNQGCFVEYTEVQILSKRFYTFSLESFGNEESTESSLNHVCDYLQQSSDLTRLAQLPCQGYAEFLNAL
jgi:hypothetical protein